MWLNNVVKFHHDINIEKRDEGTNPRLNISEMLPPIRRMFDRVKDFCH
jgi:hypothetical protein